MLLFGVTVVHLIAPTRQEEISTETKLLDKARPNWSDFFCQFFLEFGFKLKIVEVGIS